MFRPVLIPAVVYPAAVGGDWRRAQSNLTVDVQEGEFSHLIKVSFASCQIPNI